MLGQTAFALGGSLASKYLRYFPQPLLEDFALGRWLPVVGAGMSLNAKLPSPKRVPLWKELGDEIAKGISNFQPTSALDSISAYQYEYGRAKLVEKLMELLFVREASPGDVHRAFCSIPFDLVCTTNFDFLLERQYDAVAHHAHPVIDEAQLSINLPAPGTLLLKLHGDLRHPDRLIATEDDYDSFLAKYPLIATYLANQLITKTAVLVGYSLDDPDFRQIWALISNRLGKNRRPAYSIMVGAHASEVARFDRRGVKVINLPGTREKYGEVLTRAFDELREYRRDSFVSTSEVTEEKPLQELKLPRGAATRLCYFALPTELLSLYRSKIFPVVEQIGLVPVTTEDIISPGDSLNATIDTLLDRAAIVVIDLGLNWRNAAYILGAADATAYRNDALSKSGIPTIVVVDDTAPLPEFAKQRLVLRRPSLLDENAETFAYTLASHLSSATLATSSARQPQEAVRLLDAGETRAAVISAITLLESQLAERLRTYVVGGDFRPRPIRRLIEDAQHKQLILLTDEELARLMHWITIRNAVVHTDQQINKTLAAEIVFGVLKLLGFNA